MRSLEYLLKNKFRPYAKRVPRLVLVYCGELTATGLVEGHCLQSLGIVLHL
jgi:hypothetical protein